MFKLSNVKFFVSAVVALIILGVIFSIQIRKISNSPTGNANAMIKIPSGLGANEISGLLYEKSLIQSRFYFKLHSVLSGKTKQFQPGTYDLPYGKNIPQLVDILTAGPTQISVVIFPGMTLKEADAVLSAAKVISPGGLKDFDFISLQDKHPILKSRKTLEGLIFPDTYKFYINSEPQAVVDKILVNFKDKVYPQLGDLQNVRDNDNLIWLTIASLLEKEIIDFNDQKIVAGILKNRLVIGMPLQVDATVIYAKCGGEFLNCEELSLSDFKNINSPYNTYKYKGLPPTPIDNPGLQSITAALNPEKTDYLYYLSDPKTKKTIFSKTFAEHSKNRLKYIIN